MQLVATLGLVHSTVFVGAVYANLHALCVGKPIHIGGLLYAERMQKSNLWLFSKTCHTEQQFFRRTRLKGPFIAMDRQV